MISTVPAESHYQRRRLAKPATSSKRRPAPFAADELEPRFHASDRQIAAKVLPLIRRPANSEIAEARQW